jgi:phosphoglycerol transferase MdoB-like AlkP superfamily enzyme
VAKDYAHKDTLLASMGVDEVFGTEELARYITDEPKAWGYSDHQMIPVLEQFMSSKPQPFLMMLSTVDTHPPFSNVKDAINYQDGQTNVLNTFHTTDDAFRKFWKNFKASKFYDNTIVIAVADHAIFPAAYNQVPAYSARRDLSFYDENTFLMYLPHKTASSSVFTYSSGIDFAPTVLQTLGINSGNAFDGHSIFDDRGLYPNLLGMHELGLYINQTNADNKRQESFSIPATISCDKNQTVSTSTPLTLCEYLEFYRWKRSLFETGRLWSDSF